MNVKQQTLDSKVGGQGLASITRKYMMLIVLIVLVIFFSIFGTNFFSWDNAVTVCRQVSIIGICATGMMFALLTGHIDLSIGSTVSFAAVFFAKLVSEQEDILMNPALAMLVVLLFCALIGVVKGLLVVVTNMPALIATLAVSTALEGVNYLITDAKPISKIPDSIAWLGQGYLGPIPMPVVIFAVIVLIAGLILTFTYIGRYIYATGSNSEAARLAGLNVKAVNVAAYVVCSCLCAVAGFVLCTRLRSGTATTGTQYQNKALTSCAVGGISLAGGEGTIYNLLCGIFVIGIITNGMTIMGINDYWQSVAEGAILAIAVGVDYYQRTHVKTTLRTAK